MTIKAMTTAETFRQLADQADLNPSMPFLQAIVGTYVGHCAVDLGMSLQQMIDVIGITYDTLAPAFPTLKAAIAQAQLSGEETLSKEVIKYATEKAMKKLKP